MNEDFIEKYKQYCNSAESYAILFVKKYLKMLFANFLTEKFN